MNGIPKIKLNRQERLYLEEVKKRNYKGERFSFKDVYGLLHKQLPKYFRASQIDKRLVTERGEELTILGVIALERNYSIIKKVDLVIDTIWKIYLGNPQLDTISFAEVSSICGLSEQDINFCFKLAAKYKSFYRGGTSVDQSLRLSAIQVDGDDIIFLNYKEYSGIANLIKLQGIEKENIPQIYFTPEEAIRVSDQLDRLKIQVQNQLADGLRMLESRQRDALELFAEEIDELKPLLVTIPKKQWYETFFGKMALKEIVKIVLEIAADKTIELLKPVIKLIGEKIF